MIWWIAALNSAAALIASGFGIAAALRPRALAPLAVTAGAHAPGALTAGTPTSGASESRETSPVAHFYALMYAARSVPLGIAVAIAAWAPAALPTTALLLGVAAVAQIVDAVLGIRTRQWGMVAGATFATLCHLLGIIVLL